MRTKLEGQLSYFEAYFSCFKKKMGIFCLSFCMGFSLIPLQLVNPLCVISSPQCVSDLPCGPAWGCPETILCAWTGWVLRCAGARVLAVPVGFQLVNCVSQTCILTPLPLTLVSSVLRVLFFSWGFCFCVQVQNY